MVVLVPSFSIVTRSQYRFTFAVRSRKAEASRYEKFVGRKIVLVGSFEVTTSDNEIECSTG
jgi:hypothetical protein